MKNHRLFLLIWLALAAPIMAQQEDVSAVIMSATASYPEKMAAISLVGRHDIPAMMNALQDRKSCARLSPVQERACLNEVMNRLRELSDPEDKLEEALIRLAGDEGRDPGVREYALQHLALSYKQSVQKDAIVQALLGFADGSEISSTALLQLNGLMNQGCKIDQVQFQQALINSCRRDNLRIADKVTLLAVINSSRTVDALPSVREWAATAAEPIVVMGSIDVMRKLGGSEDLRFLNEKVATRNLEFAQKKLEQAREELTRRIGSAMEKADEE